MRSILIMFRNVNYCTCLVISCGVVRLYQHFGFTFEIRTRIQTFGKCWFISGSSLTCWTCNYLRLNILIFYLFTSAGSKSLFLLCKNNLLRTSLKKSLLAWVDTSPEPMTHCMPVSRAQCELITLTPWILNIYPSPEMDTIFIVVS